MNIENTLLLRLNDYFSGDPRRIQHAAKVYLFASLIADAEHLDEKARKATVLAAIVHDVGIKVAEMKYGRCDGPLQEKEGHQQKAIFTCDGSGHKELKLGEKLVIRMSPYYFNSIMMSDSVGEWLVRLAGLMSWNERKHQKALPQ